MIRCSLFFFFLVLLTDKPGRNYPWVENYDPQNTIVSRIKVPTGFIRVDAAKNSFAAWLRQLPLKPNDRRVKLWNGEEKQEQNLHCAVVDLDFIGGNLQQCVDALIRIRAEYLRCCGRENEIAFSYSCCNEKITWKKWKDGWRTKIISQQGKSSFEWIKKNKADSTEKNFRRYLYNVMNYAGTLSLSRDMKKIDASMVFIGDAFVQGATPGMGRGVLILDMAETANGKKIMLLGQSFNPAENFNVLKSGGKFSPWFEVDFSQVLNTPQWAFSKEHAKRFE